MTVIVPVFNEARTIDELLRRVLDAPYEKQVIVVEDGSTDDTGKLLEKWNEHPHVAVLQHEENRGKTAAIRSGLAQATGRFTVVQDADLEYDPEDYPRLIEPLLAGEADVIYGSRHLRPEGGKPRSRFGLFRCGVSVLNVCVRVLYGVRLTDEATCYKAFPTELLRSMNLESERFGFCPEVTAKTCRLGKSIKEVPVRYYARTAKDGKKIRLKDGYEALAVLWKWRKWNP